MLGTKVYSSILWLIVACILATGSLSAAQECDIQLVPPVEITGSIVNARHIVGGPLLMGIRTQASEQYASELATILVQENIRGVLGLHPPAPEIRAAIEAAGIEYHYFNFHWFYNWDEPFMDTLIQMSNQYGIENIAIHCQHGVDRTGNAAAFLLATQCHMNLIDAYYLVVAPTQDNIAGLEQALAELGYPDAEPSEGIEIGLFGLPNMRSGMHAHNDGFRAYIINMFPAALQYNATP